MTVRDVHGHPVLRVAVPRITRRFASSLHTTSNVAARLAGWRTELSRLQDGRLPLARLKVESGEPDAVAELRRAVVDALDQGYAGGIATTPTGATAARLALPDTIAETVDLDALRHDWLAWLAAADVLDRDARARIAVATDELARRTYASYIWSVPEMGTTTWPRRFSTASLSGTMRR